MNKLILLILPFILVSCQNETNKLTDIEKIDFQKLIPEEFYKKHNILNRDSINVDSLNAYDKTINFGSFQINSFDLPSIEPKHYINYSFYLQEQQDFDHITEKDFKEKRIFGVRPVNEIAYFQNIKFNYVNFILDDKSKKVVGCIFNTRNNSEMKYYRNSIGLITEKLGKPLYTYNGFTNDNGGGPVHYPLIYDIWIKNGKIFQFNQNFEDGNEEDFVSISLLILDEKLFDLFDSSQNMRFDMLKDFFDEKRNNRFMLESMINERIDRKDIKISEKKAKKILDSIKNR